MLYLLERLAMAGERTEGPAPRVDLRAVVRSQIQRVVSSHFWPSTAGLDLMGLNLPPIAGYGYAVGRDVSRYSAGIAELIGRHEPRLSQVRVSVEATGSALMPFQVVVTGRLPDEDDTETFRFELPRRH